LFIYELFITLIIQESRTNNVNDESNVGYRFTILNNCAVKSKLFVEERLRRHNTFGLFFNFVYG